MTKPKQNTDPANIKALFQKALNLHGHPFQYAVMRRADKLWEQGRSRWKLVCSEFPVEVQGYHTRIDFILRQGGKKPFRFLVAECKRVNPSYHNWFFARAPYVRRGRVSTDILIEKVHRVGQSLEASLSRQDGSENIYHIPVEVKGVAKGDSQGTGRGAIESAATQVIRGVNGLIECFRKNLRYLPDNSPVTFIPVIFTTARVWATDADIAAADLDTGQVVLASADMYEKPWLWFQYNVSPGLQHTVDRYRVNPDDMDRDIDSDIGPTDLGDLLEIDYARAIAVVGPNGIDDFFVSQRWIS